MCHTCEITYHPITAPVEHLFFFPGFMPVTLTQTHFLKEYLKYILSDTAVSLFNTTSTSEALLFAASLR